MLGAVGQNFSTSKVFSGLYEEMVKKLRDVEDSGTDIVTVARNSISIINQSIYQLKDEVLRAPFINEAEEIHFFKEVKPRFISLWVYWHQVYDIETSRPVGSRKVLEKYFESRLELLNNFFERNLAFYQYYRGANSQFDQLYFVRKETNAETKLIYTFPDADRSFSTGYDYVVARIHANEMIYEYINDALFHLDDPKGAPGDVKLTWTAQKVALAELIYALHAAGVFNNALADVGRIVNYLNVVFNIKVGHIYKIFEEIRLRKRNRTAFLDNLKTNLLRKMQEDDELAL